MPSLPSSSQTHPVTPHTNTGQHTNNSLSYSWPSITSAAALAESIRAVVKQSLGLTVSVGVAPNRLLAKLASRAAKPDGVWAVDSVGAVQQLLRETSVDRLPGG